MNPTKLTGPFALLGQSIGQYRLLLNRILRIFAIPVVLWLLVALLETIPMGKLLSPVLGIAAVVASFVSQVALIALLAGNDEPHLAAAVPPTKRLILPFIWITILSTLVLFGATILLVIPGLIFGIWLSQAMYLMVAENERGFRALAISWSRVSGYWWAVFGRTIILALVMLAAIIIVTLISGLFGSQALTSFIINAAQFLVLSPIAAIYTYRLYRELRTIKGTDHTAAPELASKRKWLIGLALLGLLLPLVVLIILAAGIGYMVKGALIR